MRYYPEDDPDSRIRHYPEDGPDFCGDEASQEESAFPEAGLVRHWHRLPAVRRADSVLPLFHRPQGRRGGRRPAGGFLPGKRRFRWFPDSDTASGTASSSEPQEKLDLNTATQEELEALPAIGPVRARGHPPIPGGVRPFPYTVEQVVEVEGIGEKTLEQLRPYITVEGESSSPSAVLPRSLRKSWT